MKELWDKIEEMLCSVKSDKYLHFIAGAGISLLLMMLCRPSLLTVLLAVLVPLGVEVVKEACVDPFFNWKDLAWTMAGTLITVCITSLGVFL